jgi:hypothetical protein
LGICRFEYSSDGEIYTALTETFQALPGKWIGAKVGLFCNSTALTNDAGYVNVDWFRVDY